MSENLPPTARPAAAPPPGAPAETTQALGANAGAIVEAINPRTGESYATEDWHTMTPAQRARHNERELKPLTYTGPGDVGPRDSAPTDNKDGLPKTGGVAESVKAAAEGRLDPFFERLKQERLAVASGAAGQPVSHSTSEPAQTIRRIKRIPRPAVPDGPSAAGMVQELNDVTMEEVRRGEAQDLARVTSSGQPDAPVGPPDPFAPVDLSVYPAASDSDTPSKGIPRDNIARGRPGLEVTGAFGDAASLQYYALNGAELRVLVEQLMDEIHARIQNDLRFNEALCYPQVTARVVVEITGFAHDADFLVDKVLPPGHPARSKTPLDVARQVADEVCFVVVSERQETDADGNAVLAPDAMRQELELPRPGKRTIVGPGGVTQMVDVG
jgi:hypothetical protein